MQNARIYLTDKAPSHTGQWSALTQYLAGVPGMNKWSTLQTKFLSVIMTSGDLVIKCKFQVKNCISEHDPNLFRLNLPPPFGDPWLSNW